MRVGKSHIITLILLIWGPGIVLCQRTPLFPEYDHNPIIINPAYAGMTSGSVTSLSHNRYTKNMEGSPQSSSLSHHFPLSNEKMGMGAVITDDRIGVTSHTSAVIAYSYKQIGRASCRERVCQ